MAVARGMKLDAELSEKELTGLLVDLAKQTGWKRYHTYRSERSPAGWPDEQLVRDRIVFAELKVEAALRLKARKPTPLQQEWLTAIARAGGEVYLWIPSDLAEIARVLQGRWLFTPPRDGAALPTLEHATVVAATGWTPGSLWLPSGGRADGKVVAPHPYREPPC